MIHEIIEIPKVGDVITSTENLVMEKEILKCVLVKPDDEVSSIWYAFFQSVDDPNLNDKIEDGVRFYIMKGYGVPSD